MNILIFLQNSKKGGVDTFVSNLINFWPDKKSKIYLICNKSHPGIKNLKQKLLEKKILKLLFIIVNLFKILNYFTKTSFF